MKVKIQPVYGTPAHHWYKIGTKYSEGFYATLPYTKIQLSGVEINEIRGVVCQFCKLKLVIQSHIYTES